MWDQPQSSDSLQQPTAAWRTYLAYLVLLAFIFLAGYISALVRQWRKRRKASASEPEDVATELRYLEEATERAKSAVTELSEGAKPKTQTGSPKYQPRLITHREPEKEGRVKGFVKSVRNRFHKGGVPAEQRDGDLASRVKKLKLDIQQLADEVYSVGKTVYPDPTHGSKQKIVEDIAREQGRAVPAARDDYPQQDQISTKMFNFNSAPEQTPESAPAIPISRANRYPDVEQKPPDRQPAAKTSNTSSAMIELYNCAVMDSSARERFREQYRPLRLGTVNAVERRQNPTIDAEFREATHGDFFAIKIAGRDEYVVVPRLGLTIESVSYTAGALGRVFNDPPYEPGLFYSRYRLRQPAIFKRDGDRWELDSPGDLDLGQGDP
jgi:hypothetical protein